MQLAGFLTAVMTAEAHSPLSSLTSTEVPTVKTAAHSKLSVACENRNQQAYGELQTNEKLKLRKLRETIWGGGGKEMIGTKGNNIKSDFT